MFNDITERFKKTVDNKITLRIYMKGGAVMRKKTKKYG